MEHRAVRVQLLGAAVVEVIAVAGGRSVAVAQHEIVEHQPGERFVETQDGPLRQGATAVGTLRRVPDPRPLDFVATALSGLFTTIGSIAWAAPTYHDLVDARDDAADRHI